MNKAEEMMALVDEVDAHSAAAAASLCHPQNEVKFKLFIERRENARAKLQVIADSLDNNNCKHQRISVGHQARQCLDCGEPMPVKGLFGNG